MSNDLSPEERFEADYDKHCGIEGLGAKLAFKQAWELQHSRIAELTQTNDGRGKRIDDLTDRLQMALTELALLRGQQQPETASAQSLDLNDPIQWALKAHEDAEKLHDDGGGNHWTVRLNRACKILFARVADLEKIAYPIKATENDEIDDLFDRSGWPPDRQPVPPSKDYSGLVAEINGAISLANTNWSQAYAVTQFVRLLRECQIALTAMQPPDEPLRPLTNDERAAMDRAFWKSTQPVETGDSQK